MVTSSSSVISMFGKSPFKALQLHMESVTLVTAELSGLMEALNKGDQAQINTLKNKISKLEGNADELKNSMRSNLPKSFFMPVDRRDLLEILDLQDNIADNTEAIATLATLRTMEVPVGMGKSLVELCALSVEASNKASSTIAELHLLVESGFDGREADKVSRMIVELSALRAESSEKANQLCRTLFGLEDQLKPVAVFMWEKIIGHIAELAHNAEQVGDRLRLLMAR